MDPDQLLRSLRDRQPPMPPTDCAALDLWECHPDDPVRPTDVSLRWVQLDDDAELEAIIVTEAKEEWAWAAYVFDYHDTWNLVGSFFCRRCRHANDLIRVQKLTEDSPPLVLVNRDLGGSGSSILMTEGFQVREGKLWPVFRVTGKQDDLFPFPHVQRQQVFASETRLVVHTVDEKPPGRVIKNECEVWRWDGRAFASVAAEFTKYCDAKTGKPIPGKSFWAGLPVYP
jgi:hypothetical protein